MERGVSWIPVTERLPEPGVVVVVWTGIPLPEAAEVLGTSHPLALGEFRGGIVRPKGSPSFPDLAGLNGWLLYEREADAGYARGPYEQWCWLPLPPLPSGAG